MWYGYYVFFGLIAVLLAWGVITYNRFVSLLRHTDEAWSGVRVQLKRRHDLIPNLVETVKGYAAHERGLLEEIAGLRSAAMSGGALAAPGAGRSAAHSGDLKGGAAGLTVALAAEQALGPALGRLFAVVEAYPELKANENFNSLQGSLAELEEQLQLARRYYNGMVRDYSILRESFPSLIIAGLFKFEPRLFFDLDSEAEAAVPQVRM